jgi:acetylornithine deacetylase
MLNMSTENNLDHLFNNSIEILTDLIGFKTISGEDNSSLIDYCDNILKKLGATSFRTYDDNKQRVNLFATLKSKSPSNKKPIILSGHTDVVPVSKGWTTDPFKATIKNDKLYGRGSCDMKGFIACTLAFAPIYSKTNLDRDIHFSFTFDEETACQGAPILIEELKKRDIKDGICIIGEPTNMKIIDAHKGCYEYTTYFKGLAGHSSTPNKGVSAVEYAARYVNKLIELREKLKERAPQNSIFDPPYSTLSKLSAITALIPSNFVPLAAQSLDDPVPYSLPPITTKSVPLFLYSTTASYTGNIFSSGYNFVNPPSVPGAISFLILILAKVPLIITS